MVRAAHIPCVLGSWGENHMYTFHRTLTLQNGAQTPKAIGFAMELTGYVNKTFGLNMRCGMEMFGGLNMHWQFDVDSLDKLSALNTKLMEDTKYWTMVEKGKEYFLNGSLKDTVVMFPT
jgi:hypothetical protein